MKDRQPTYPGRVTLTPVSGQTNTYDMAMADEPTENGTPPTKAYLLQDGTADALGLEGSARTVNGALSRLNETRVIKRYSNMTITIPDGYLFASANYTKQCADSAVIVSVKIYGNQQQTGVGAIGGYCNGKIWVQAIGQASSHIAMDVVLDVYETRT